MYKYNSTTKTYQKYKDTKKCSITVTGLKAEKRYLFKVAAYKKKDGITKIGKKSAVCTAYTAPKQLKAVKITAPKTVSKGSSRNMVQLKWKKVSGATGYRVYYKTAAKSSWKLLKKTSAVSMKISVKKGKTNYFRVAAYRTKNKLTTVGKYSETVKYSAK
ncbi:MAG: fibronectin type III domain-containing protein [Lachnospiraceae bacterium]|nr:fibronectin type III domain-containing protein [Lachnospiraceae bacterium]